jgi:hypothetical protein
MSTVRSLHSSVQATLGAIQGKTSLILQEQERDLLRSFKVRLADVVAELERERKKNESGSVEWVQRCRSLTEQLVWQQELTGSLSSENKHLLADNRRMARAHQTMEADRAFLIKQLVGVKKENARLRFLVEQQIKENQELTQHIQQQQQQQQYLIEQQQQQHQQQLLMPSPTASSGASGSSPSPLTQRSLAAHNNGNGNGNGGGGAVVVPSLKLPAQFHSGALIPANMRQSLLAAATTEGSLPAAVYSSSTPLGATSASQAMMHMMQQASSPATGSQTQRPATSGGMGEHYLPPTGHVGPGGRATSGAQSARLSSTMPSRHSQPQAHPNLPEARLSVGQEARFKSVIASLKRRLDSATHEARAAKTAFVHAVQAQTQLQHLFKQCVESVRETSAARRAASGGKAGPLSPRPPAGLDPRSPHWPELSSAERASVLEWLLSQHSVMTLLFDKMFPAGPTAGSPSSMEIGGGSGLPQLYSSSEHHHSSLHQQQHAVGMHFDYAQFMVPPKGAHQQQQPHELIPSSLAQRNAAASATAQQQGSDDADEEYEQILLPSGTHAAQAAKTGATKANKKADPTNQVNRAAYALSPRAFDDAAAVGNAAPVAVDYFAPDDEAEQRAAAAAAHKHSPLPPPPAGAGVAKPPVRSAVQVQHLMQSRAPKPQQHEAKE